MSTGRPVAMPAAALRWALAAKRKSGGVAASQRSTVAATGRR
jgi:hypothetical protein